MIILNTSLTESNTNATQKLSFGVNTAIELQNITITRDSTRTLLSQNILR